MIRKERQQTVWWAFAALGLGVAGTTLMWSFNFADSYWRLSNGSIMHVDAAAAVPCLLPWRLLECRAIFSYNGYPDMAKVMSMLMSTFLPLIIGLGLFVLGVYQRWLRRRDFFVLAGPQITAMTELAKASAEEPGAAGLRWFGAWTLSRRRETNSFALLGAVGSGKTNLMLLLAEQASARGDKILAYAFKPELIRRFPDSADGEGNRHEPMLIAPHDERSWVWDIAKDINGEASASTVAAKLVPEGDLSFFDDAARAVCTAMIVKLHRTKKHRWTWADLLREVEKPIEELLKDAETYYPPAVTLLSADRRQSSSTHSTLQNAFNNLRLLALAWPTYDGRATISVRQFILGSRPSQTLILGHSGDYPELSDRWISLFIAFAAMAVQANELEASDDRRIWFFLDEFGRLPKVPDFKQLLVTGREKGIPVVLGLQDMHQVQEIYGPNEFKTWMSSIGTKVICRTEVGETTRWFEDVFGMTRVREFRDEFHANGEKRRVKDDREEPAFRRDEFASELGVRTDGIDVLVTGVLKDHALVRVPFAPKVDRRPAYMPAGWVIADQGREGAQAAE